MGGQAQTGSANGVKFEVEGTGAKVVGLEDGNTSTEIIIPNEVTLSDGNKYVVTIIADNAFKDKTSIASVKLPNGLVNFWDHSFDGCTALKSITIPASVEHIYNNVFQKSGLESITFENGSKLDYIGDYAFGATQLKSVALPPNLKTIVKYAFADTPSLETITVPNGLESIGDHAFKGTSLKGIVLPNTLKSLGEYAFEGTQLSSIVIPSSVTEMGNGVFYNCSNLKTATINSGNVELKWELFRLAGDVAGGIEDLYITPEKALAVGYCFASTEPAIHVQPKLVDGYKSALQQKNFAGDKIDSKVKITLNKEYATYSSAFNIDFSQTEELKAYKGAYDAANNSIRLTQVQNVPAWNGVVLKGEAGKTYELPIIDAWTDGLENFEGNMIYASVNPTWLTGVDGGDYILSNGAFHPISKNGFLAAGRAYFPYSLVVGTSSSAKELAFSFDNTTTAIHKVAADKLVEDGVYYTLSGVKTVKPVKGIYIHNGKKYVCK